MKKTFMILVLLVGMTIPAHTQTLDVYWGLNWSMSPSAVDSVLMPISKAKKIATQTSYGEDGQSSRSAIHSSSCQFRLRFGWPVAWPIGVSAGLARRPHYNR